ncbi:ABC transporter substrate-binding protein [Dehalobacter sp. DCM]|uniref:ABC transporter substrate-binding protein n=1 Tax=Dehalobacter sp. DCM TaxID=2907827 RepID=UPI003082065A|nr:ABC transporter substrate-binding protein [Dehalobacter sp. DCM]
MKVKRILSLTTAIMICLFLAVGCSAKPTATIKIGGNFELTGGYAIYGKSGENGVKLAIKQINEKGGILKKQLEYFGADNHSKDAESTLAATQLITQNKVAGIIGPMTSPNTIAAIPIATENNVPLITPTAIDDNITMGNNGLNNWVFRACFSNAYEGEAAANFAADTLKVSRAAVIVDKGMLYSNTIAASFIRTFENSGGKIVSTKQYNSIDTDFRLILSQINSTGADLIFIPGNYNQAGEIIKQARQMKIDVVFLGGDGWGTGPIAEVAGKEALNKAYYLDQVAMNDPALADFAAAYKAEYGEDAPMFAALAYDAANMLITAIEKTGSTDTDKVREALENMTDFQGITGNITVDPTTHNPKKSVTVIKFVDGVKTFETRIEPK